MQETNFDEMICDMIVKDPELKKALRGKVAEAISKLDLTEIIGKCIADVLEQMDIDLEGSVEKPIAEAVQNHLQKLLKIKE